MLTIGGFVTAAALGGEFVYLVLYLARFFGIFDLRLAAQNFGNLISLYTGFWVVCKLGLWGAILFFTCRSATQRRSAEVDL